MQRRVIVVRGDKAPPAVAMSAGLRPAPAGRHAEALCELAGESIAVACGQPKRLHVRPSLQGVGDRMSAHLNGRHDWYRLVEQPDHGFPKVVRGELHLPELVDQDDALLALSAHCGERHSLERLEVDAVAAHAGRPGQLHVSQDPPLAIEALDLEANAATTLA